MLPICFLSNVLSRRSYSTNRLFLFYRGGNTRKVSTKVGHDMGGIPGGQGQFLNV